MLKQSACGCCLKSGGAAAFGRLCVETGNTFFNCHKTGAAAFGRLCVETFMTLTAQILMVAAAFGRLCVETRSFRNFFKSSLAAAFGRLCVETMIMVRSYLNGMQPPSGGCVLKLHCANT